MFTLFLSPAIYLMNRLKYLYKFALIYVIFLLPLLGFAYMQLNELSIEQRITQVEVKGIIALKEAFLLTEIASDIRDLIVVQGDDFSLREKIMLKKAAF